MARYYISKEQFYDDVELMCRNAIAYNEDDSDVNRDAQQILVSAIPTFQMPSARIECTTSSANTPAGSAGDAEERRFEPAERAPSQ